MPYFAEQYVVPGNIIFRQRGTHWFPGENCDMGRDHTIFATQPGFVKYYKDPLKHPKRQYIGVAFERHQVLPTPPNAARRRRLGMLAIHQAPEPVPESIIPVPTPVAADSEGITIEIETSVKSKKGGRDMTKTREGVTLKMSTNYMFREGNWEIGMAAERAGVQVRKFERGDRFLAWRKSNARKAKNAEKRSMGRNAKKAKPRKK
jgi:large subunit ribosomal protein L27